MLLTFIIGLITGAIVGFLVIIIYRAVHLLMQKRMSHGYIEGYKTDLEADQTYMRHDKEEHSASKYRS